MKELTQLKLIDGDVQVRMFVPTDADALFSLTDKNRQQLREWLGWLDMTKTIADTEKFIQNSIDHAAKGNGADCGIYYQGTLVGVIGYMDLNTFNKKVTIGYWLDKDAQGKGIMTRAVTLLITFAFTTLHLHRVQITCGVGNNKSRAIPHRLGFTKEGIARETEWLYDHVVDWEIYSLLSSEWKPGV